MKAKKVLAVLMASAMIMGTSVTAFAAAPEGNITITSLPAGAENAKLMYVQIITEDRESPIGWTFADDTVEKAFVNAWLDRGADIVVTDEEADQVIKELFAITEHTGEGEGIVYTPNENVKNGDIHSSVELSRALAAVTATEEVTGTTIDPGDMGLYMITASKKGYTFNPMVVYVGPEFNGVTVQAKGSEDQVKKEAEAKDHTVASGDVLDYTVTADYPYYPANATNTKFVISDTIENATFNEDSVSVTINGQPATEGEDYLAPVFDDDKNEMSIQFKYNPTYAGDPVVVTYKATAGNINSDAEVRVKNNAKAETDGKYTIAKVESDSATFTITKVDSSDGTKLLSGAEFTLYVKDENGAKTIKYENEDIKVSVVEAKVTEDGDDPTTKNFTEEEGKVTFFGIDPDKEYYVEETDAPVGYSKLENIWKLKGASSTTSLPTVTYEGEDGNKIPYTVVTTTTTATDYTSLTVENTTLSSLPSTGGIGTTIFTIGGCAIMVTAAGLYFATRKKTEK